MGKKDDRLRSRAGINRSTQSEIRVFKGVGPVSLQSLRALEFDLGTHPQSLTAQHQELIEESVSMKQARKSLNVPNREDVIALMKLNGSLLHRVPLPQKDDKEVVWCAVQNRGQALEFASDRLKDDPDIVMAAVRNDGWALQFASSRLKSDRAIVMAAVKEYGWALALSSDDLKNDREIVIEAVRHDAWAIEYASETLKKDSEVLAVCECSESRVNP